MHRFHCEIDRQPGSGLLRTALICAGILFAWVPATLHAQAVIEGTVQWAARTETPEPNSRYQIKSGTPGKPEPALPVVYLEGAFPAATNAPARAELPQKDFQFLVRVLPVRKGATVDFPNHDDDYHNVFSYSKTKRFDLGRYRKDEKPASITFDKPGVVKLYCEIHEHMRASIVVLETPYFQKTDTAGRFRLEGLPAGKHTFKVWHEDKIVERSVELKDGETLKLDLALP